MSRSELTHQQIIDVVSANQGANSRKIADALSIFEAAKRKPFLLRLNYLVGKGLLRVKKENGTNYYYSNTPTALANTASAAINSAANPDADLTAAASAIAEMMIRVIEGPLRARVEQTVQAIIKDATKNFQAQVMAAIGNVPAISIPINLMPSVQPQPQPKPATAFIPTVEAKPAAPKLVPQPVELPKLVIAPKATEPQPAPQPAKWTPNLTPKQAPAPANIAPIATKSVASSERMKLAVIGLKPGQAHMIKNEYGRQINLSFIESDGGHGKQLGALSKTCDYVIQMTKFTNHATGDHIAAFGGKLVLVSGGMTTLRDKITDLYVAWDDQRKAKAA